jgi:hypothetical protein
MGIEKKEGGSLNRWRLSLKQQLGGFVFRRRVGPFYIGGDS